MAQRTIHCPLQQDKHLLRTPFTATATGTGTATPRPSLFQSKSISSDTLFHHETSAKGLVDQFYTSSNASELEHSLIPNSTSPNAGAGAGAGVSRQQSLDKFEIKTRNIPNDKLKLNELRENVLKQIKAQMDNDDYESDSQELQDMLNGIKDLRNKLQNQLQEIERHHDEFGKNYNQRFKIEVEGLFQNLSQINVLEQQLLKQRDILDRYKHKLQGIRCQIEINEQVKLKNWEMMKFRNKLGFIGVLSLIVIWISYKIVVNSY